MSYQQVFNFPSNNNPIGVMVYAGSSANVTLTPDEDDETSDIFYTAVLEPGIYSFKCNYTLKNILPTTVVMESVDFGVFNNSSHTMSQQQIGVDLVEDENTVIGYGTIFSVDSSAYGNPVNFKAFTTFTGPENITRSGYNIQLCRIC